jgi:hypothetical protein
MSDQTKSEPEKSSTSEAVTADNEAQVGLAGEEVLTLLRRAIELADGNSRYAVEIVQKMSDQLWGRSKEGGGTAGAGHRVRSSGSALPSSDR